MTGMAAAVFLGALVVIATMALPILLAVWTYRDAQSKNMNGILWTLVVILAPSCIGLIIYLIVRMDNNKVQCSNCNAYVNGKNKFCSNCGMELIPVTEYSEEEAEFKKSQRNILIGFFSTLGGIVVLSILMVAFLIIGGLKLAGNIVEGAAGWVSTADMLNALENSLEELDVFFDDDEIHFTVQENPVTHRDKIILKDKEGNELIVIDGTEKSVDVELTNIRELLDRYGIDYDERVSEEEIRREIEEAIDDIIEEHDKMEK